MIRPLKLKHCAKTAIWGGIALKEVWKKTCEFDKLAESWELTVRGDAVNEIENGEYRGRSLKEYIEENPECMGKIKGKFPLLIKLIDAEDNLSIQVHPDDEYAALVENDVGKTEMWYIVDAKKDAEIIYGLLEGVEKISTDREIMNEVKRVKVKKGDCFFIPSGMLHAIGSGCLIAEIQQNSDLTYRVYDYDRRDKEGNPRELHKEKAAAVIRSFSDSQIEEIQFFECDKLGAGQCLASCKYFCVNKISLNSGVSKLDTAGECFHSLLCIEGEGEIVAKGESYKITKGDSYFVPADMGKYEVKGSLDILVSRA